MNGIPTWDEVGRLLTLVAGVAVIAGLSLWVSGLLWKRLWPDEEDE